MRVVGLVLALPLLVGTAAPWTLQASLKAQDPRPQASPTATAQQAMRPRTDRPRREISGAFQVTRRYGDSEDAGLLLIGRGIGLLVEPALAGSGRTEIRTVQVAAPQTNRAGDVSFRTPWEKYDGYQTDEGFTLVGHSTLPEYRNVTILLVATRADLPLEEKTGLYVARCQTTQTLGRRSSPDAMDWTGEAAVTVVSDVRHSAKDTPSPTVEPDVVTVQLVLRSGLGEQATLFGSAQVDAGGSFTIESDTTRLSGALVNGTLVGTFTYAKDNGMVHSGQLKATRR